MIETIRINKDGTFSYFMWLESISYDEGWYRDYFIFDYLFDYHGRKTQNALILDYPPGPKSRIGLWY